MPKSNKLYDFRQFPLSITQKQLERGKQELVRRFSFTLLPPSSCSSSVAIQEATGTETSGREKEKRTKNKEEMAGDSSSAEAAKERSPTTSHSDLATNLPRTFKYLLGS